MDRRFATTGRSSLLEKLERRALLSTVTVSNLNDSGAGSLRSAIATAATSGDVIEFGNLAGTITLASPLDLADKSLTITGTGRTHLTINAHSIGKAFTMVGQGQVELANMKIVGGGTGTAAGAAIHAVGNDPFDRLTLSLNNLDIAGGVADISGGGVYAEMTNLMINRCDFHDNQVGGSGARGGALYFENGNLTVNSASFYRNTASSSIQTAFVLGGAICAIDTNICFLTNVTIVDNVARKTDWDGEEPTPAAGGGIYLHGGGQILASTIAYNSVEAPADSDAGNFGGGLFADNTSTLNVQNSIIALNTAPASNDMFATDTAHILAGFDLVGDGTASGAVDGQYGSHVGTTASPLDAKLADDIADNGGDVQTLALRAGSPAIDSAYYDADRNDARGIARGVTPDIGAFEYVAPNVPTFQQTPTVTIGSAGTAAACVATATIANSSALSYQWAVTVKPAHTPNPVFANAANGTTAVNFAKAGTYRFRVTATASNGRAVVRNISVAVNQVASLLRIIQHKQTLSNRVPTRMRAVLVDQFGDRMATQPAFSWQLLEGAGSINSTTGLYKPARVKYSYLLFQATGGSLTGVAGNRLKAA